jgi:putative SOS response-associated peptidase YedK
MCGGVEISGRYTRTGEQLKIYFPNPRAALPVLCSDGSETVWVPWGRRREQPGKGPQGGWARLSSIEEGKWQKYGPTRVRIPAARFMEKDEAKNSHWFDLQDDQVIEGLVIGEEEQQRVYVITTDAPRDRAWVHDRWPLLCSRSRLQP